jgi:hypothetical protein
MAGLVAIPNALATFLRGEVFHQKESIDFLPAKADSLLATTKQGEDTQAEH